MTKKGSGPEPLERPLPHNPDAERWILGAILADASSALTKINGLLPEDFFLAPHRHIFRRMLTLAAKQQPIDFVTLTDILERDGELEAAGGASYITSLTDGMPRISNVEHHARIVKENAGLRLAIHSARAIQEAAFDGENVAQVKARFTSIVETLRPGGVTNGRPPAKVISSIEYLSRVFPPREPFVTVKGVPVFTGRSINQVFGWRGTGKSMFAQGLAGGLATGTAFLNFVVPKPRHVLYVDGELPSTQIQARIRLLYPKNAFLEIIDLESQGTWGIPSLVTAEGQQWLEAVIEEYDIEVLILDSQTTLAPFSIRDDESQVLFNQWLHRLRARGLCVITLHQAGKLGGQRLKSDNDDPLDVQIKLSADDEERDHLKCTLHYDKFRELPPGMGDLNIEYRAGVWSYTQASLDRLKIVDSYFIEHPKGSAHRLADEHPELGSLATVKRLVSKWRKLGSLDSLEG